MGDVFVMKKNLFRIRYIHRLAAHRTKISCRCWGFRNLWFGALADRWFQVAGVGGPHFTYLFIEMPPKM